MVSTPQNELPLLSIVLPCFNEAGNIGPFLREIAGVLATESALKSENGQFAYEIIVVDDASLDKTVDEVREVMKELPFVRLLRHAKRAEKSCAVSSAVGRARADWICTLDGDGQNDPKDLPRLLAAAWQDGRQHNRLIIGQRQNRTDGFYRLWASRFANMVRDWVLEDGVRDSGCGFKIFPRHIYVALPFFDGMHRFSPAMHKHFGAEIIALPVADRPRQYGVSKYSNFGRALVGFFDLFALKWLLSRQRNPINVIE